MARPSKYETHVAPRLEEIKDWCRNGATDEEIAQKLGISLRSFYEYKREFLQFSQSLKETKEIVDSQVENALLQNALKGNTIAQIFWLKNRRPDKWREKPVEEKPDEDNSISVTLTIEDLSGGGNA